MRVVVLVLVLLAFASRSTAQNGFIWPQSAAPGETVDVFASASNSYQVTVYRSHDFGQETPVLTSPSLIGVVQSRQQGSYAHAPTHPDFEITGPITLEAWVRPLTSGNGSFQGIVSKYDNPGGTAYGIYLMPSGQLSFYLGSTGVFSATNRLLTTAPIPNRQWTHVVATWDGTTKRVYLNGVLDVTSSFAGPIYDTNEPVRVASFASSGVTGQFFDGQIDSPAIYSRALTPSEIVQRTGELADYGPGNPGVLAGCVAQWNFGERDGSVLADATGNGHVLELVNYGTRGVPGPSPRTQPDGSHSIRFASDEEINFDWTKSWSFVVPSTWESGFYVVAIGSRRTPFVVKPAPGTERRIAVLANTNTWHAYNTLSGTRALYGTHNGGDVVYYVGMRQTNPAVRPSLGIPAPLQHLVDAERHLYKWLDDNGYAFDLYSDLDLHRDPNLLAPYDVLMLNGHSEYWSHRMMDHVEAFQAAGGSLINLSGNTMWSLVTFDETDSVMEGRKFPHGVGGIPNDERWHSQDGEPLGGTMRCIGRPEHEVIGTGYGIGNGSAQGWAKVLEPSHWVFGGTGVALGEAFGTSGANGPMMSFEIDEVDAQWTPAGAQVLARGVYSAPAFRLDISNCQTRSSTNVLQGGDIVYYDHPGGGGVFGIPSVTAGGALRVDAVASRMVSNVLNRFACAPARVEKRIMGNNADVYTATTPVIGESVTFTVDTQGFPFATVFGVGAPRTRPLDSGDWILINIDSVILLNTGPLNGPIAQTTQVVSNDPSTCGVTIYTQAKLHGAAARPFRLTNSQDLVLGH